MMSTPVGAPSSALVVNEGGGVSVAEEVVRNSDVDVGSGPVEEVSVFNGIVTVMSVEGVELLVAGVVSTVDGSAVAVIDCVTVITVSASEVGVSELDELGVMGTEPVSVTVGVIIIVIIVAVSELEVARTELI